MAACWPGTLGGVGCGGLQWAAASVAVAAALAAVAAVGCGVGCQRRLRWLQTLASLLLRLNWMSRRCFIIGHGRKVLSHFISPSFQCHGGGFRRQPIADERSNFTRRGIVHFKLVIGFVFKMVFGGISFTTRVEKKGLKTKVTKCA